MKFLENFAITSLQLESLLESMYILQTRNTKEIVSIDSQ